MRKAVGLIETKNVTKGILLADRMLKKSPIEILKAISLCPGKYMVILAGDLAAVYNAVQIAKEEFNNNILDSCILGNIDQQVIKALSGCVRDDLWKDALGIIETYTVAAAILSADIAVKTAVVDLVKIKIAQGLAGKCYIVLTGDVAAVETSIKIGISAIKSENLVDWTIIPSPAPDLWTFLLDKK